MNWKSYGGDMDPCPQCGGVAFGKLAEYWICVACGKLLELIDPRERQEEERRHTKSFKKKMLYEVH